MVQRWLVVAVLLFGACSKKKRENPAAKAKQPPPACDVTKMTQKWAYQTYVAETGGNKVSNVTVEYRDTTWSQDGDVFALSGHPCCDIPSLDMDLYWHCTRYVSRNDLMRHRLIDAGWDAADPGKRVELVSKIVASGYLEAPPKTWNPHKPFSPRKIEPTPDGGVKIVGWSEEGEVGGQGDYWGFYVLAEQLVTKDAELQPPKETERYELQEGGYPDPKIVASCDPAQPPTKEWASTKVLERKGRISAPETLALTKVYEDVWELTEVIPGRSDPRPEALVRVRRCKAYSGGWWQKEEVVPDILADRGWAKATPEQRIALAREIDSKWLSTVIETQPARWDPKHTFKAPTAKENPDHSIVLTRWTVVTAKYGGYTDHMDRYGYLESELDGLGRVTPRMQHESFELPEQ